MDIVVIRPADNDKKKQITDIELEQYAVYDEDIRQYAKSFVDMYDTLSEYSSYMNSVNSNTNIVSVMVNNVIRFFKPILEQIPNRRFKMEEEINKYEISKKQKQFENRDKSTNYNIQTIYNVDIKAIVKNKEIIVPSGTPMNVIGMSAEFQNNAIEHIKILRNKLFPNITDVRTGDLSKMIYPGYMHFSIDHSKRFNTPKFQYQQTFFTNDEEAIKILKEYTDHIKCILEYYNCFALQTYKFSKVKTNITSLQPKLPKTEQTKLQKIFNELLLIPVSKWPTIESRMYHILDTEGLIPLLNLIQTDGLKSSTVQSAINDRKQYIIDHKQHMKTRQELLNRRTKMQILLDLAKIRFNKPYHTLEKKQRDILEKSFSVSKPITESEKIILEKLYVELADFNLSKASDWYKELLKVTKTPNICSHVEFMLSKPAAKLADIRTELINKYCYADKAQNYYCKECGEKLIENFIEVEIHYNEDYSPYEAVDSPLEELIYRECSYLVRHFLKFKSVVDVKQLTKVLMNVIKPSMYDKEAKLLKIRTYDVEDVRNILMIQIATYSFAFMAHLIINNYGKVTFNKGDRKTKPKKESLVEDVSGGSSLVNYTVDDTSSGTSSGTSSDTSSGTSSDTSSGSVKKSLIIGGKNAPNVNKNILTYSQFLLKINIKNITQKYNITPNALIEMFNNAYDLFNSQSTTSTHVDNSHKYYNRKLYIILSGLYNVQWSLTKSCKYDDVKSVIGKTPDEAFESSENIFSDITPIKEYDKSLRSKYMHLIHKHAIMENTNNDYIEAMIVPRDPILDKLAEPYEDIFKYNKATKNIADIRRIKPISNVPFNKWLHFDYSPNYIPELHKKPDGTSYKFDKYVFANKKHPNMKSKNLILTQSEVIEHVDKGLHKTHTLIDMYDSDTKITQSQIKPNEKIRQKILDAVKNQRENNAIVDYYQIKCPEGGTHDLIDGCCSKCQYTYDASDKFINKYRNKYIKDRSLSKIELEKRLINIKNIIAYNNKSQRESRKHIKKHVPTNNSLLQVSKQLKINFAKLKSLGTSVLYIYDKHNFENYHMNEIEQEIQMFKLFEYYYWLITIIHQISVSSELLPEMIDKTLSGDRKQFKSIVNYEDIKLFEEKIVHYYSTQSKADSANYIIDQLCKYILKLPKPTAKAVMNTLLEKEQRVSKPDPSKIKYEKRYNGYFSESSSSSSDSVYEFSSSGPEVAESATDNEQDSDLFGDENNAIEDTSNIFDDD